MLFCPTCANCLLVEKANEANLRFYCQTCPYVHVVSEKMTKKIPLKRKEVDDVFGGADAWENVDQTQAICPRCDNGTAYYMQIQIRSADEPMTTFYKCTNTKCDHQWRED